ncbi:MAG: orotate phosphoribosyltransferase [Actinobacteria bacterium]|nr:MAG: orotate phosphoribosyltransferase [Actinomycetota bacterium]
MDENPYRTRLIAELVTRAVRTDGPFTLASGEVSSWYVDARQVTFDGAGAAIAGRAVLSVLDPGVTAVGGMTMGADPIAFATAIVAVDGGRPLRAFSVRKTAKGHGTGGRIVGPLRGGDLVAVLEDTTTTGSALMTAITAIEEETGAGVVQAISLVDRSGGQVASLMAERGVAYTCLATPDDLGVVA